MPRCFVPTILSTSFFTAPWKYCKPHRRYSVFLSLLFLKKEGVFKNLRPFCLFSRLFARQFVLLFSQEKTSKWLYPGLWELVRMAEWKEKASCYSRVAPTFRKKLLMLSYLKYLHRRHLIFHLCMLFQFIICANSNILHVRFQVLEGVDVGFDSFSCFFLLFLFFCFYINNHLRNIKYVHSTLQS